MDTVNERSKAAPRFVIPATEPSPATAQAALELVADYVRASGVRDPNEVAALANACVRDASQTLSGDSPQCECLAELALKLASAQLGLACAPGEVFVEATVEMLAAGDVVPPIQPRVMPQQELDELLPIAEPDLWRRLVRAGTGAIAFVMAKVRIG